MTPQVLVFMAWFLALIGTSHAQKFACNIPSSSQNGDGEFLTLSQNYQATIAVRVLNKNYSMMVEAHTDYAGHRAALTVHKGGKSVNVIFSSETNEVFYITGQSCKIYTLDNHPYSFLLRLHKESNIGHRGILETVMSITNSPDSKPVYSRAGTVRDIPSDIWSACLPWQTTRGMLQATYYFSKLGWITSSSEQQTLLRIDVQGESNSGQTNSEIFHHIYDFISYLPNIHADPSIFMTPPHVVCLNRKSSKPVPRFASDFKYRAEIIDFRKSFISYYAFWYDEKNKLLREDRRTKQTFLGNENIIVNTTTEIRDFNTGIQYIMNSTGCSIKYVNTSEADTDEDVARFQYDGALVVDVRDPNSLFLSHGNYAYTGQRTIRGITCDVFNAIIPHFVLDGVKHDAVYEYAFLADGLNDLPLYGQESHAQHHPVQLVISIPSINYSRVYNFFEFAEDFGTYPTFDISNCYSNKIGFGITFTGTRDEFTAAAVHASLVEAMNVSAIRVGGITINILGNGVYVNAYVLPTSTAAQFKKLPKFDLGRVGDKVMKGITTADDCAVLCIDNADFLCKGFQYCQYDGFACTLTRDSLSNDRFLPNATACDDYTRSIYVATKREPLLNEAYASLQDKVRVAHGLNVSYVKDNAYETNSASDMQLTSGTFAEL